MPTKNTRPRKAANASLGKFLRGPFVPDASARLGDALWESAVANRRARRSVEQLEKIVEDMEALDDETDDAQGATAAPPIRRADRGDVRSRSGTSLFLHTLVHRILLILRPVVWMLVAATWFSGLLYVLTR